MKIPDWFYDIMKNVAQTVLPALGTLYFALATIWHFPYGEQIVGTITALDAFLGACLHISTKSYPGDGVLHVDTTNMYKDTYSLDFETPLDEIGDKKQVLLKVDRKK